MKGERCCVRIHYKPPIHTRRPRAISDSTEQTLHLLLILGPLAADQWHAHSPETPSEKGDPSKLLLPEPAASAQHAGPRGKLLDHVKVRPLYVIGHDNCTLAAGDTVAGKLKVGTVGQANVLYATPHWFRNRRGDIICPIREDGCQGQ